ncbi:EAL domain-containing protein [Gordonia soli]|uniref:EAL domain-containing protein n=1 Tax=Gordonia soli NBRC 108243 TaxID=1223545 RepID=M0QLC4_9ACTN|nr:hypothetical protein GS4_25_00200 [Gordonia soli NBRC 108243]
MQFAPVRRLDDGSLAAAELQLRGLAGSALNTPDSLRRAARLMEQKPAFDRQKVEFSGSAPARAVADLLPLLVTLDMESIQTDPSTAAAFSATDESLQRLVLSVSPDRLIADPQRTLAAVAEARAAGRMICVDGMGVDHHAVTLLPLVEPDIIITGPDLLTRTTDPDMAEVAHALAAHVERSHAVIVAEGVDTEELRLAAMTIGATYGIGALYPPVADPADLVDETIVPLPGAPVWSTPDALAATPYALASRVGTPRRGTKRLLVEMSKSLEAQAAAVGQAMIVVGTFQHAQHFTALTSERWHRLADITGFAGVYGVGLSHMLDGNIQHAPLDPEDDLVNEWTVAVLGPHFSALLSARDLHDNGPDLERTFDFIQSFDRMTVTQAVHTILTRFTSAATTPAAVAEPA